MVDVYDALTSDRPYKRPYTHQASIEYMRDSSGSHFDPELLEQFLRMAPDVYEEVASLSHSALEKLADQAIERHFGVNLPRSPMRSKYSAL